MSSVIDFDEALGKLDKNPEMIREYWRDLRANWQANENSLRRTLFYILVLAASFMLLSAKGIGGITLLGLKVTNLSLVGTFIPALIAYLIYVASTNAAITFRLAQIHDSLAAHYWPGFYDENLELTVRPVGSVAETALIAFDTKSRILRRVSGMAGYIKFLVCMFAPIVFNVYATWQLFARSEGALWLECAVAAFFFFAILVSVPNFMFAFRTIRNYGVSRVLPQPASDEAEMIATGDSNSSA